MSISIMSKVWKIKNISTNEKFVLLALSDFSNDEGFCWPSYIQLAKKCSLTERSLIRIIQKLIHKELLTLVEKFSERTPKHSNFYQVNLEMLDLFDEKYESKKNEITEKGVTQLQSDKLSGVTQCHERGDIDDTKGVTQSQGGSDIHDIPIMKNHHNPSKRTIKDPSLSRSKNSTGSHDDKKLFKQKFEEFWTLYPRKIGKTPAWKKFEAKCQSKCEIAEEILRGLKNQIPIFLQRDLQFIPHASTWLNQERWRDEIEDTTHHSRGKIYDTHGRLQTEAQPTTDRERRRRIQAILLHDAAKACGY